MLIVDFYYTITFVPPARHIYFLCMTHFDAVLQKITSICNQKKHRSKAVPAQVLNYQNCCYKKKQRYAKA